MLERKRNKLKPITATTRPPFHCVLRSAREGRAARRACRLRVETSINPLGINPGAINPGFNPGASHGAQSLGGIIPGASNPWDIRVRDEGAEILTSLAMKAL